MRLLTILLLVAGSAAAQTTIEIVPTRDNTLYESASGSLSNGAGTALFVGRTQTGSLRRAVLGFDDLGAIPAGAQIINVELELRMNRTVSPAVEIGVHRLRADWGEAGSLAPGQQGGGGNAQAGDATWIHRFFDTDRWDNAGGDFDAAPLTSVSVGGNGAYTFPTSADFVSLVQSWVDNPASNFGVILVANEAAGGSTAKRFSSREVGSTSGPRLRVTFMESAPPEPRNIAGLWFDADLPGDGYNVIQSEAGLTIFFFGYTAEGQRLWLVTNTVDTDVFFDETVVFDVLVGPVDSGNFDSPVDPSGLETWGTLEITFTGCGEARFELTGVDGTKISDTIKLTGVIGNDCSEAGLAAARDVLKGMGGSQNIAGLWFDPDLPGDGYNVIQSAAGLTIFFFGYGADGQRLWLVTNTVDAEVVFGEAIQFEVLVGPSEVGNFETPVDPSQLESWGMLEITFTSCTEAIFELMGNDGSKVSEAIKLTGVIGNTCG